MCPKEEALNQHKRIFHISTAVLVQRQVFAVVVVFFTWHRVIGHLLFHRSLRKVGFYSHRFSYFANENHRTFWYFFWQMKSNQSTWHCLFKSTSDSDFSCLYPNNSLQIDAGLKLDITSMEWQFYLPVSNKLCECQCRSYVESPKQKTNPLLWQQQTSDKCLKSITLQLCPELDAYSR